MRKISLAVMMAAFAFSVMAQELNVASFNIKCGTSHGMGNVKSGNGWDDRKGFIFDLINFAAFDIFGAQEVRYGQLNDLVKALPDYAYIGVGRDDGKTKGEFCPVFYRRERFKLLDSGTFWLSATPETVSRGWDGGCNRVCSWGYFQDRATKAKFYFLNTHLDHKGPMAKTKGAELIVKFIEEHCKGVQVVVTGDMNVYQDSEWYNIFAKSGYLKDTFKAARYRFAPSSLTPVFLLRTPLGKSCRAMTCCPSSFFECLPGQFHRFRLFAFYLFIFNIFNSCLDFFLFVTAEECEAVLLFFICLFFIFIDGAAAVETEDHRNQCQPEERLDRNCS